MAQTAQVSGRSDAGDKARALVLEEKGRLSLRECPVRKAMGPRDVRVAIHTVGICGSDVHYYTHGAIDPLVVRSPMILGHEASGTTTDVGGKVQGLAVGGRVRMEPGIPNPRRRATRTGLYNLDPDGRFRATPSVHGALRASVVHPADFIFLLPDSVSLAVAAMVEPLAVGVHAVTKALARPRYVVDMIGAGPIGLVTVLAALAAGCSHVVASDVGDSKRAIAAGPGAASTVNVRSGSLADALRAVTVGCGPDVVYECSGTQPPPQASLRRFAAGGV